MSYRLNRLFASDGHCLNVAVDHGLFGESSLLPGLEDIEEVIEVLVTASPDAIQLSPGQAWVLQSHPSSEKPSLVLRTDITNVYGRTGKSAEYLFSDLVHDAVRRAVQLDAVCIVVNLLGLPDRGDLLRQCVRNISFLRAQCDDFGMPLMLEPLAMNPGPQGYESDHDVTRIMTLVRQAVELGADVIKTDPPSELEAFSEIKGTAGSCPLLVRGGSVISDEVLIERTETIMRLGASGIVYGRNIVQHADPREITKTLMSIVHGDLDDNDIPA